MTRFTALSVLAAGALGVGAWTLSQLAYRVRERRRFAEEHARYEADASRVRREGEAAELVEWVSQHFPNAADAVEARCSTGEMSEESLRAVLSAVPGVRIGGTTHDLPVVVPHAIRTRHLCCWGRTGTGKTSLALRLIADDLTYGRGLVVVGAERELFRDHLLGRVPDERVSDLIYFAPGLDDCPVRWNPFEVMDDDRSRAAAELFAVFRRALSEESLGPQSDPIARNTFLALVGMPGATFLTARALLEDQEARKRLLPKIKDEVCRAFFESSFEKLPRSAARPLLNRLDAFAGAPGVRRCLCQPQGNLNLAEAIDSGKILFIDLAGFDPDTTRLLGQLVLAYLQLALMRRERMPERERRLVMLYADECHELIAKGSVEVFRQLLSKGRRYQGSVNAFSQFPGQIDPEVRQELFGNCGTVISLAVSSQDAGGAIRRELLVATEDGTAEPVPAEALVSLPIGCAYGRIGTGALALPIRLDPPDDPPSPAWAREVQTRSWERFRSDEPDGARAEASPVGPVRTVGGAVSAPAPDPDPRESGSDPAAPVLSPDERRFLDAVLASPGRNSSEYARLARMSGATAVACRNRLVTLGLLCEHRIATGGRGRKAIVLEPVPDPSDERSVRSGDA